MLYNINGAKSYKGLRTIEWVVHKIFYEAARAAGYTQSENHCNGMMM